jgi:SAM-dependent methyltransferase
VIFLKEIKLNLGCGAKKRKGWVNCDFDKKMKPDKCFDLNDKWPFEDESVDEIYSSYVAEHVRDINNFISETNRVLKRGGTYTVVIVNSGFWRCRLSFLFGKFTDKSAFSVWHCWLFKPRVLREMFKSYDLDAKIEGRGLLPWPDLFYYRFEIVGRKRQ